MPEEECRCGCRVKILFINGLTCCLFAGYAAKKRHTPTRKTSPAKNVGWYVSGMRVKTSVSLPSSLLKEIDRHSGNRSAFLEEAANFYLAQSAKRIREAKDAVILEKNIERLNREATDVLEYQSVAD
jgi:hypothetical protein